ncbi:MAG: GTP 3',8-cyclase MoaA [Rhodopseudomonas palustris]|uniref:GTP 3',8-cyclase n=1 Tax=Rhodopseudomonas palustris TaxID=1076 RepID=A0A933S087_RHOPL|nr:GTP 3',8-cyclase MoaA [Rhodopseudomonas palustris]
MRRPDVGLDLAESSSEGSRPMAVPFADAFGRRVKYLRLSVTDRCDLRCRYCMSETMEFLPSKQLLSFEELDRIAGCFIACGVETIRVTGGEPLVRKEIVRLFRGLSRHLSSGGLRELTLTTNGTQLARHAEDLHALGVRRVNVSMDSLDPEKYATITRGGSLARVLEGIEAARRAGLAVKLNAVALKGFTETEIDDLIGFAHRGGMTLTLIETMPLGEIGSDRTDQFLPLTALRRQIEQRWTLVDLVERTGGPARYARVVETGGKIGFITPMTHNFCGDCNRVRVTASGVLHACLGQENAVDLRRILRGGGEDADLIDAIGSAVSGKPRGHDFQIGPGGRPSLRRHMSATGG